MPKTTPITVSVVRAFRHSGRRNAGTPFEIASTPVIAVAARREGVQHNAKWITVAATPPCLPPHARVGGLDAVGMAGRSDPPETSLTARSRAGREDRRR